MRASVALAVILLPALLGACAGYRVIPNPTHDTSIEGVRYYGAVPYIFVRRKPGDTAKGGSETAVEIHYLPDRNEEYVVQSWSFLASEDLTIHLADGSKLDSLGSKSDSTALVKELAGVLKQGTAAGAFFPGESRSPPGPDPQDNFPSLIIFRLRHDPATRASVLERIWPSDEPKRSP